MKTINRLWMFALAVISTASLTGCFELDDPTPWVEPENVITFPDLGANGGGQSASFSTLEDVSVAVAVEGPATSLTVTDDDGNSFGQVAISGGTGTFTATRADLGIAAAGGSVRLSVSDGTHRVLLTVSSYDPISLDVPADLIRNADSTRTVEFEISTTNATVETIAVTWAGSDGSSGTVAAPAGGWSETDSFDFEGSGFDAGVEVTFTVTATAGTHTAAASGAVDNKAWVFNRTISGVNLLSGEGVDITDGSKITAGATGDLWLSLSDAASQVIGLASSTGAEFVRIESSLYTSADIHATIDAYDNAATVFAGLSDMEVGDTFLVKVGDEWALGMVSDLNRTNNDNSDDLTLDLKYLVAE